MKVIIAGAHGKIGLRLARLLGAREVHPVGLVRKPEQQADLIAVGAHPVLFDLESGTATELADILRRDPAPPNLRAYRALLKQPVDAVVLSDISRWIESVTQNPATVRQVADR